jgi:hypothetical protein
VVLNRRTTDWRSRGSPRIHSRSGRLSRALEPRDRSAERSFWLKASPDALGRDNRGNQTSRCSLEGGDWIKRVNWSPEEARRIAAMRGTTALENEAATNEMALGVRELRHEKCHLGNGRMEIEKGRMALQ